MTKTNTNAASCEAAVRKAAADFKAAAEKANDAGLHVTLPRNLAGFDNVMISETDKAKVAAAAGAVVAAPSAVVNAGAKAKA